jgi:hypothetical protein
MAATARQAVNDPQTWLELERPKLYAKQRAAIYDPHRYSLIEASTKAGKTSGCISWITDRALRGNDGWNYWWVAPVSDQSLIAFRRMMRALPQDVFKANISLKTITLINGCVVWFKSGDKPNSLYGEDVYAAVIDEASRMKEDAYVALRSTLTFTRGPLRIIGNVRGRHNWFYKLARRAERDTADGLEPREMTYHKLIAWDAVQAGVLSRQEIDDARDQMPEVVWRELYLAEASDDGGNPFGLDHIAACVVPNLSAEKPVCWGWDFAKQRDYTVGIALDKNGHVCRFERWHLVPWGETINRVVSMTGGVPALGDSTGLGDPVVEGIQRQINGSVGDEGSFRGYHFTSSSKQKLMEGLSVAIQTRTVRYQDNRIRKELDEFGYEYTRTGVRYSIPEGDHDDCVMALALANMCRTVVPPPVVITPDFLRRMRAMPPSRRIT